MVKRLRFVLWNYTHFCTHFLNRLIHLSLKFITLGRSNLSKVTLKNLFEIHKLHISNLFHI